VKFEEFIDPSNEVVEIYFTVVVERVNVVVHGDKVLIGVEEGFVINVGMKLEAEVVIFVSVFELNVVDEMDATILVVMEVLTVVIVDKEVVDCVIMVDVLAVEVEV